jgi:hypothetical protein
MANWPSSVDGRFWMSPVMIGESQVAFGGVAVIVGMGRLLRTR